MDNSRTDCLAAEWCKIATGFYSNFPRAGEICHRGNVVSLESDLPDTWWEDHARLFLPTLDSREREQSA